MKPTEAIVRTAMYLKEVNSTNKFVPDWQLRTASERFGLDLEECRIIQSIVKDDNIHVIG